MARYNPARSARACWDAFRACVEVEHGGTVVEPEWLGNHRKHRVICAAGHACAPRPAGVQQGRGICPKCAGKVWDQFYVVLSPSTGVAKLGITSGDPRDRLRDHRRAGFAEVIRLVEVEGALDLERAALDACRYGGYAPLKGREYFDVIALPTILDVVDHWPS